MADHWKSTPSYWCKFCAIYVRDTPLERKNHEASGKHQSAIQRNLRDLQRGRQREEWDKQNAKNEVERLNGLVSGEKKKSGGAIEGVRDMGKGAVVGATGPVLSKEAQRKRHAEELLALGVELPEELKREVTGVGGWQTVGERVVVEKSPIVQGVKKEEEVDEDRKDDVLAQGVRKRKVEDGEEEEEEDPRDEEAAPRRKAWGSRVRRYPGKDAGNGEEDLDTLLSGVAKKKPPEVKQEDVDGAPEIKEEAGDEKHLNAVPDVDEPGPSVKADSSGAVPAVVFKKRKVKR